MTCMIDSGIWFGFCWGDALIGFIVAMFVIFIALVIVEWRKNKNNKQKTLNEYVD